MVKAVMSENEVEKKGQTEQRIVWRTKAASL